jgi:hypothetical protein
MADSPLEKQMKLFLKRASTELKRTGGELRGEAERLFQEVKSEVKNPETQKRVRENLQEMGAWARKAAGQAAAHIDVAVRRLDQELKNMKKTGPGAPEKSEVDAESEPAAPTEEAKPAAKKARGTKPSPKRESPE